MPCAQLGIPMVSTYTRNIAQYILAAHDARLTIMGSRLHSFPVLVCVSHKVGVSPRPSLHATRVEAHRRLLIEVLEVLSVQGMLHSWLMWCLRAV